MATTEPARRDDGRDEQLSDAHIHLISIATREIYVHSFYSSEDNEEPGVEYRMATTFVKNLHLLERQSKKPIVVHMHTVGGEWADGMAMYDAIRLSPCPITVIAYAHARSMSSIIIQAADKRVMMPHADFMIHYGMIALEEVSHAAKSSIDWNERASKEMLEIYCAGCMKGHYFTERGLSKRQVLNFLDKKMRYYVDWWMGADEAVDYGFIDGIMGSKGFETIDKVRNVKKRRD